MIRSPNQPVPAKAGIPRLLTIEHSCPGLAEPERCAMGHHLFIHDRKSLPMRDGDVALVRHFLIEGATRLGDKPLADAITGWQYQGPGVWVGIDEATLAGRRAVFSAGIEAAEKLGEEISVDYLNGRVHMPRVRWLKDLPSSDVVGLIRGLEDHLHGR